MASGVLSLCVMVGKIAAPIHHPFYCCKAPKVREALPRPESALPLETFHFPLKPFLSPKAISAPLKPFRSPLKPFCIIFLQNFSQKGFTSVCGMCYCLD